MVDESNNSPTYNFYPWVCPKAFAEPVEGLPFNVAKDNFSRGPIILHSHDFIEIAMITNGKGSYKTPDAEFPIRRGDIFLIPKGNIHAYSPPGALEVMNLLIQDASVLKEFSELSAEPAMRCFLELEPLFRGQNNFQNRLHLDSEELNQLIFYWERIAQELREREEFFRDMVHNLVRCFLSVLCRFCNQMQGVGDQELLNLAKALRHIETQYGSPITCPELARISGRNQKKFTKDFLQATGKTPANYLLTFRLKKACEKLANTDIPIQIIAQKCGFCDASHFGQQFQRHFNLTPSAYRMQHQGTQDSTK